MTRRAAPISWKLHEGAPGRYVYRPPHPTEHGPLISGSWSGGLAASVSGKPPPSPHDAAAFPRAKQACVAPCREHVGRFLAHRERIMRVMGDYAFEGRGLTETERRDKIKALFNSLDMDGTLGAWRVRVGLRDGERPLADYVVDLGQAGNF